MVPLHLWNRKPFEWCGNFWDFLSVCWKLYNYIILNDTYGFIQVHLLTFNLWMFMFLLNLKASWFRTYLYGQFYHNVQIILGTLLDNWLITVVYKYARISAIHMLSYLSSPRSKLVELLFLFPSLSPRWNKRHPH